MKPPLRVGFTYPAWEDGRTVQKELPFILGVVGDFTGKPRANALDPPRFIEITAGNVDWMARTVPGFDAPSHVAASWSALRWLVSQIGNESLIHVRMLSATRDEILLSLPAAIAADPEAYGVLLIDREFGRGPEDRVILQQLAEFAGKIHTPVVSGVDRPAMDRADGDPDWRFLREMQETRYIGLCGPRFHLAEGWASGAYLFGARLIAIFKDHHWCAVLNGPVPLPGPLESSANPKSRFDESGVVWLNDTGDGRTATIVNSRSLQRPKPRADLPAGFKVWSNLLAQLPFAFGGSRCVHYLQAAARYEMRDCGSKEELERRLQAWLSSYFINSSSDEADKATHPLGDAIVHVMKVADRRDIYQAVAYLRPHFQLELLLPSMRLEFDIQR